MARRQVIIYTDDVTGQEAPDIETVIVTVDNIAYEVDMSAATRAAYAEAVEAYRSAGRRVGRVTATGTVLRPAFGSGLPAQRQSASPAVIDKEQNKAVRDWWRANEGRDGLPSIVEHGRIPQTVRDAFQKWGGRKVTAEPDVKPSQEKRKAGTVGAEITFSGTPDVATPKPAKATKAASKPARSASVKTEAASKPQGPATRGRRAVAG